jgi:hypothetical protein
MTDIRTGRASAPVAIPPTADERRADPLSRDNDRKRSGKLAVSLIL